MPTKSTFRQPGATHFQLVHRSQRDPLIHDPDAPQHVLKQVRRGNDKHIHREGKSRTDLEAVLGPEIIEHDTRANVGEAALYGIYFDDTEYDYMQHLRPIGTQEESVESILVEAPQSRNKSRQKEKRDGPPSIQDLPPEALPSEIEMPRNFEIQEAVPSSIAGFQPDMDPHLRQTLDALEDGAFVDDGLDDDFFTQLVQDGERHGEDDVDYEFFEYGPPVSGTSKGEQEEDEGWEARFVKFKKGQTNAPPPPTDSDEDIHTEGGDTVGNLPKLSVIGGKRIRKGASDASGYSMSSSSMYRTEALLTLDERFDQLMAKEYGSDEGDLDDDEAETASTSSVSSSFSAPDLITSREDYDSMVDEFIDKYELVGRKLKPVLAGDSGAGKLETLRRALGQDERMKIITMQEDDEREQRDEELFRAYDANEKGDRWDCETILTTYSNLENHPRVIRVRSTRPESKIKLDPRTGLPTVVCDKTLEGQALESSQAKRATKQTVSRARDESKEDKRIRKQAVKVARQARRADKKSMKEQFNSEMKHQAQSLSNRTNMSRLRKL